jgi:hypothetical protein
MTVHLLKMAVGIDSVDHLKRVQKTRLAQASQPGGPGHLRHLTRNMPKRAEEVLDGGSIYWVIKGYVRVRQRVKGLEWALGREGRKRCALILDPKLVKTVLMPQRPIQGWRYLDPAAAPPDLAAGAKDVPELPPGLAEELRELGLL